MKSVQNVMGSFENKRSSHINTYDVYGTTLGTPVFYSDERDRYFHIYFSYEKTAAERCVQEDKPGQMTAHLRKLEGQAVTATQTTILKTFGINANYIKSKVQEISDELDAKILKVKIKGALYEKY